MKKTLFKSLGLLFALLCGSARAEVFTQATVVQGSSSTSYTMYNTGKMYFSGNKLVIDTIGTGAVAQYNLGKIDKLLLSAVESSATGGTRVLDDASSLALAPSVVESAFAVSGIEGTFSFRILNAAGQVVATGDSAAGNEINVEAFSSGVYFIQINGNILKFVKL